MSGYFVKITRDFDTVVTNVELDRYADKTLTRFDGLEYLHIPSERFNFPIITSGISLDVIIENDAVAQAAQDALELEISNLKSDVLALDIDMLSVSGPDADDIKKILKLVRLITASQ
jgi:hypothetical protein